MHFTAVLAIAVALLDSTTSVVAKPATEETKSLEDSVGPIYKDCLRRELGHRCRGHVDLRKPFKSCLSKIMASCESEEIETPTQAIETRGEAPGADVWECLHLTIATCPSKDAAPQECLVNARHMCQDKPDTDAEGELIPSSMLVTVLKGLSYNTEKRGNETQF